MQSVRVGLPELIANTDMNIQKRTQVIQKETMQGFVKHVSVLTLL